MSYNSDSSVQEIQEVHIHRDDFGSKMGMWLFLFTEILLFGGLFILYAGYRFIYSEGFAAAATELDVLLGTINTVILLTSSLTVVLAIVALQKENKKLSLFFLWVTVICGLIFLVNKYFEWGAKFHHGVYPKGPALQNMSEGEVMYFGLYFVMTGLHGLHIVVGLIFIGYVMRQIQKDVITSSNFQKLENSGLYWHLVDIIWIFLFPLFYLIH
ncbi:MAG: cytochrome c oxidase subunit 3 family protein [Ignavibacteria bacterium]|nr:cytochrome c oxidase subunit 3 family protein [Ignavibacteria bacterium]MBK7158255.1 cytochrome c oxidase subunit 3 family protein [Ignavibacteria bacterium]MBK7254345.1 cytochrome c oxidase subunit 3 family protein [Ignavibacteria bacterium]MBK7446514.1 cytochrome c oxidase subunit 3 family protein [Ignavibacteria bacterium]MBK9405009.1 cytochrome c oxidase subunit 3 family protein [Ignavibacteria bacterium]